MAETLDRHDIKHSVGSANDIAELQGDIASWLGLEIRSITDLRHTIETPEDFMTRAQQLGVEVVIVGSGARREVYLIPSVPVPFSEIIINNPELTRAAKTRMLGGGAMILP